MPSCALAAGFAKESLFLSQTKVTAGSSVIIYAPLQNQAEEAFTGKVLFTENDTQVGSVSVSLNVGEARIVSVSWTPATEGTRKLSATLQKNDGATLDSLSGSFSVLPKPKVTAAPQQAAAIESSKGIQDNIEKIAPPVAVYVAPGFAAIDSVRNAAADVLDSQLASTKQDLGLESPTPGAVLAASQIRNAGQNPVEALLYFLKVIYLYILTILRFIIGSAAVFYPIFAIGLLWVLWKTFRRFRRPTY